MVATLQKHLQQKTDSPRRDVQRLPSPRDISAAHQAIDRARAEPTGTARKAGQASPISPGLSGVQAAVLHAVVNDRGFGDGWCFSGTTRLSLITKFSTSTIEEALAKLVAKGWLDVELHQPPKLARGGVAVWVSHYRLTPVLDDMRSDDETEAAYVAARTASAARKQRSRAKAAAAMSQHPAWDVTPPGRVTVTVPGGVTAQHVTPPGGADTDPIQIGKTDNAKATVAASKPQQTHVIIDGIGLSLPVRRTVDVAIQGHVRQVLAALFPDLIDCSFGATVLASERNLPLREVADAMRCLARDARRDVTPADVADAIRNYGTMPYKRGVSVDKWMQRNGITVSAAEHAAYMRQREREADAANAAPCLQ